MLYLAGVAGGILTLCGILLLVTDRAYRTYAVEPDNILDAIKRSREHGESAVDGFVRLYATRVDVLRSANAHRVRLTFATQGLALFSLLAVLVELVYSLHARLAA